MVDGAAVLEAAVEAKNGRLYVVDGVLTPPSIKPVLPHRCDITDTKIIKVRPNSNDLVYFKSFHTTLNMFCLVKSCHNLTSTHRDICGPVNTTDVPVCPPDLNAVISFIYSV